MKSSKKLSSFFVVSNQIREFGQKPLFEVTVVSLSIHFVNLSRLVQWFIEFQAHKTRQLVTGKILNHVEIHRKIYEIFSVWIKTRQWRNVKLVYAS